MSTNNQFFTVFNTKLLQQNGNCILSNIKSTWSSLIVENHSQTLTRHGCRTTRLCSGMNSGICWVFKINLLFHVESNLSHFFFGFINWQTKETWKHFFFLKKKKKEKKKKENRTYKLFWLYTDVLHTVLPYISGIRYDCQMSKD